MDRALVDYLEQSSDRQLAGLIEFARFRSISGSPEHEASVGACAAWLLEQLSGIGLEHTQLLPTGGNPIVYGDWLHAAGASTVLVYGHYDVQPSDPDELWTSAPFEPVVRDGRLYARGVSDNKGQIFAALVAIEALLAVDGRLPCNVRVFVEGEEETGAENLTAFLAGDEAARLLQADLALVTDCGMLGENAPGVTIGLRGMAALEITVRTARSDLHSGVYGGTVPNAAQALAGLLAGLRDEETGRVLVEGFYDDVTAVPRDERRAWAQLPLDGEELATALGVSVLSGEDGCTTAERLWARPTLDVCGLWSGYLGEGLKTVIPAEAHAKISCRLVPDQQPQAVLELLLRHLRAHAPAGAAVSVDWLLPGSWPVVLPIDHPGIRAALAAVSACFDGEPAVFRAGYSVPVVELFRRLLGLDSVLLGFALPDENMHAPDEFIRLDVFARGVRAYVAFLSGQTAG